MIHPIKFESNLSSLSPKFPKAETLLSTFKESNGASREAFARLWLTESVPAAFYLCPAVFEGLRLWVSEQLNVHPKEVNLTGSARVGYSFAPTQFGKFYNKDSDFDMFIVSDSLFSKISADHDMFEHDFINELITPKTDHQRECWSENINVNKRNIKKKFLDANKIPSYKRYTTAQSINNNAWRLTEALKLTDNAPTPSYISFRIYKDWKHCIDRLSLNLSYCINKTIELNKKIKNRGRGV